MRLGRCCLEIYQILLTSVQTKHTSSASTVVKSFHASFDHPDRMEAQAVAEPTNVSTFSIAAKRTIDKIRTRRWWTTAMAIVACGFLFSILVPASLLMATGSWKGISHELSLGDRLSLLRFSLPFLGWSLLVVPLFIAVEF